MVYILAIVFFIILLFFPIYINIRLNRYKDDDEIKINFIFFKGLIKLDFKIPFIDIIKKDKELSLEIKSKFEKGSKERELREKDTITSFKKIIYKYKKYQKFKHIMKTMIKYLIKKTYIKKLVWFSRIGLKDAALTGISTGLLWTFKSLLLSLIISNKTIEDLDLDIVPEYNQSVLEIYFDCIIKVKLVYIIIAGFNGFRAKLKGGEVNV